QIAGRGERSPGPEEAVVLKALAPRRLSDAHPGSAGAEARAAHPYGVDLVDEHDALAAPLAGELLGLADQEHDHDHVDPDERGREPGADQQPAAGRTGTAG